jgi:hypothetical protein
MSEFHDPELRQELGRLSGPYPDDNAAFVAWQRRVGQVRRRRAVAWTTTAALSLIVAVVGAAAIQGAPGRHALVPSQVVDESSIAATTSHPKPSTTESAAAPTTAAATVALDETTMPGVSPDSNQPAEPIVVDTTAITTATTHKTGNGSKGASPTSAAPAAPTAPPSTPTTEGDSHPSTTTTPFSSIGGTITVRLDRGRLNIVDTQASSGFQAHQTDHFDRHLEVTFTSSNHRSTITVWLDNGVIKSLVDEKTETHSDSGPPVSSSYGGGSDGG